MLLLILLHYVLLPATSKNLRTEIQSMVELLSHAESHIAQNVSLSEKPIMAYLGEIDFIGDHDQLPEYIPNTVLIQHYVEFRIVLRW